MSFRRPTDRIGRLRSRLALLLGLILLLAIAPVIAHAQGAGADTVILSWTAPGDDGTIGTASAYELRIAQFPIDDTNWSTAFLVGSVPPPRVSGTRERLVVRGLTRGTTYWFGIKAVDDNANWSGLSNVLRWDWVYDTTAPLAPLGVRAAREGATRDVRVQWNASPEADLARYAVYRRDVQGGTFQRISVPNLTATELLDTAVPAGSDVVAYQVTALDESGNESARSSVVSVSFVASIASWKLEPVYPNPSRLAGPVSIPIVVPTATGGGSLDITDAGGHTVRRLDLAGYSPGPQTIQWDGLSQAGRQTAPGVYTAWLVSGSFRRSVKLVRVP